MIGDTLGYGDSRWLLAPVAWGPLIAGAVVTSAAGYAVSGWIRQIVPKRGVGLHWYGVAFAAPFVLIQTPEVIAWMFGVEVSLIDPPAVVIDFLFVLFLAGALEEPGWRGFMQPRLQERWSALTAALAIGIIWALWHVPLVIGGGAGYQGSEWVGFFVFLPLFSIVMAWVYNSTRGGVLFVMLFHATINAMPIFEAAEPVAGGLSQLIALIGVPLGILLYYGRTYLAADRPDPTIPGRPAM
ncbi:type II CAAX prenyl endopeptidase Rce1 family protein [Halorubrum sp. DTA98]|uniref:CPBP family glutamic-type intramembrane protease n=1 Tax=Halorubrum sp. DTA98 TaxID=3402163 RepID=UPI003AAEE696